MPLGLIGKKLGMSQVFTDDGVRVPVTIIEAGPCVVTQKKTTEKDGYNAVQIGYDPIAMQRATSAQQGHFKAANKGAFRMTRELRLESVDGYEVGAEIKTDIFAIGDKVDVTGKSKGKGFQGVIKRWNHHGGRMTHGSMFHRAPGSMGTNTDPGRVRKGRRLPGHLGDEQVTVPNLEVVKIDSEKNLVLLRGSIPGGRNAVVLIRKKK
jgi:large subunit ribosomal protein L3